MKTYRLSQASTSERFTFEPNVTAVGFFDGVHKGHQKVIETAKEKSRELGLKCAVMTFDPHPSVVLRKEKQHAHYITPLPDKEAILEGMGVDYLFIVTFDKSLASLSPQQFVDEYFVNLQVKHVVAGFDFSYGHKGQGSMDDLPEYSQGRFSNTVVGKVEKDKNKISSTRIRTLLEAGQMEEVKQLLGRSYSVSGPVIKGDRRGRTIGYPTANVLLTKPYHLPIVGVYAVTVLHQGTTYYGMANLGVKPTFVEGAEEPTLEVHLFDMNEDLYGDDLTVYFYQKIRDEMKFSGVEEIQQQLKKDEAHIREFFRIL